jgi:hypothetical protein
MNLRIGDIVRWGERGSLYKVIKIRKNSYDLYHLGTGVIYEKHPAHHFDVPDFKKLSPLEIAML